MMNFRSILFIVFLFFGSNFYFLNARNTSASTSYIVYNFPPPMDAPDFPFKVVTVDQNTPDWAKMLYKTNPNITEISNLYYQWRSANPEVRNGHTRNFRKLAGFWHIMTM